MEKLTGYEHLVLLEKGINTPNSVLLKLYTVLVSSSLHG